MFLLQSNAELKKLHSLWGSHKHIAMSSSKIMVLGSGKGLAGSEPLTVSTIIIVYSGTRTSLNLGVECQ